MAPGPKPKSGAQKRRQRKDELAQTAKLPKISSFLKQAEKEQSEIPAPCSSTSGDSGQISFIEECESSAQASGQGEENENLPNISTEASENAECSETASNNESCEAVTIESQSEEPSREYLDETFVDDEGHDTIADKFPTDRGNFPSELTDSQTKRFIISQGSCRPLITFPRDQKQGGRCFSHTFYTKRTQAGVLLQRSWLCYSPKLDCAYCEPCWLFADRTCGAYNSAWVNGMRNWSHLTQAVHYHESSMQHIHACMLMQQWRSHGTVDEENEREIRKQKNFWRQVLGRVINVTLTLAMCNLPFRGHTEVIGQANSGVFLSFIQLLARYDSTLQQLLEMPRGSVRYLSHRVQDEIIALLSKKIEQDIVNEIKSSPFFSIIIDTTQDISKTDQLSQIFRYVTVETNQQNTVTALKINEVFLGFHAITDQTAASLEKEIVLSIENKGLDISRCRGQGYDGAANMSGIYTGVQARISKREPCAQYIHCAAHNLNLALNDSVRYIPEINKFYDVIEKLYQFFGNSIKRWALLSEISSASETANITLKRLCPTRWSSRNDSITALRYRYTDILKALTKIILKSDKNSSDINDASSLKKNISSFEFVMMVVLQSRILDVVGPISKCLQAKDTNIEKATQLLQNAVEVFQKFRSDYQGAKDSAIKLSEKWGIGVIFEKRRNKRVKRQFDELCQDERLNDAERYFQVNIYNSCLDTIIMQLKQRFQSLHATVKKFKAILPSSLLSATDEELQNDGENLVKHFKNDFSPALPVQLISFRTCLKSQIAQLTTVEEIAKLLIVENSVLSTSFPEVCTAYILFLTLPVTVASAERSFSKLKLIKNYLRSTMGQERLSGLAMLSIENERARMIDLNKIIDEFAERKARRRSFK
ncbi:zinc finger MYM-type protein 1-like [Rhinoderma darwinii]|uniref:zinc finger MYM-type protein 1-like n=1 Tax=Rhinoderma darwinii TaxID=43563 RepID=UPI003F667124